jgi:ribosomal protein S30
VAGGDLEKVGMGIHIRTEGPDIVVEFHRKLVPRDRDIREYCEEIWQVAPVTVSLEA